MAEISPKMAFYVSLWNDYKTNQEEGTIEESYIYRYLKQRKDEQAKQTTAEKRESLRASSRIDAYVYIQSLYSAYEKKKLGRKELISLLSKLIGEKSNLRVFGNDIAKAGKDPEVLKELHSKLLDRCLKKDIQIFFNDIGYVEKMGKGAMPLTGKTRKNNEILDLYFGFIGENEWGLDIIGNAYSDKTLTNRIDDEDYIKACKKLFEDMLKDDNAKNAFSPLFIDEGSGAGIFIIGRDQLDIPAVDYRINRRSNRILGRDADHVLVRNPNCAYYVVRFSNIFEGGYGEDETEKLVNGSIETEYEIIDSGGKDDLERLISGFSETRNLGKVYVNYPSVNENMENTREANPLFERFFIDRSDEEPENKYQKACSLIIDQRENQIYSAKHTK